MIDIKNISKRSNGWLVRYTEIAPCGCFYISRAIFIEVLEKPTKQQIEDAIRDKGQ